MTATTVTEIGIKGSPRPTFDGPTHILYENATRHIWGDALSGEVHDWIYVSSSKIHQLIFGLPSGGMFSHSDSHRTIFAADELFYVLTGTLVVSNPETGEVHVVRSGESVFFRRDTWHHGMSYGQEPLRVLEFFAPPPSLGTSSAYAKTKPNLTTVKYTRDQLLGCWPLGQGESVDQDSMMVLRDADICWRLEGKGRPVLVGIIISTEHLTVGKVTLLPGQQTDLHEHAGDEGLYVVSGSVSVRFVAATGNSWFEAKAGDGLYLPQGVAHQYSNVSDAPAVLLFGIAPNYLAQKP